MVAAVKSPHIATPNILQEDIFLVDFGMSFPADRKPADYEPATQVLFVTPEAYFDGDVSFASDVWALACVIFQIRAGVSPFDAWFDTINPTLKEMVWTLGRLPDPWWDSWEERRRSFEENGDVLPADRAEDPTDKISLRQKLHNIGRQDDPSTQDLEWSIIEKTGMSLDEAEVELLGDLLEKMIKYRPEERISMKEVVQHPWFQYGQ